MGDTSGFGTVDPSDGLRDVVRLHSGSDNDTAFDFDMANDYIFIGSADRADVILTQVSPSQWVATLAGGAPGDSLTINFLSGSEPANEDDLRLRLIDDTRYTPPREWPARAMEPRLFHANRPHRYPAGFAQNWQSAPQ